MAKFAKTTEIDISAMHEVVEEQAPKRSKWFTIIPIIISVIIAFGLWIYVTENSTDINTVEFTAVVEETGEEIELVVSGTNSNLADFDKTKVIVTYNATNDRYSVQYSNGKLQETTTINGKTAYIKTVSGISFIVE